MRFVALLMTVVCAVPSLVSAQDDSDRAAQSRIVALEKAWNQAYKLADRKALNELFDDQLVLINDDGSVQRRVSGQHQEVKLTGTAGYAGIDCCPRVRKCRDRYRSV